MRRWLRPGGRLLIADHCSATTPPPDSLAVHIARHGYDLRTPSAYAALLREAGFVEVVLEDRTCELQESLGRELATLQASRPALAEEFGSAACDALEHEWREALARAGAGEQRWVVLMARAP